MSAFTTDSTTRTTTNLVSLRVYCPNCSTNPSSSATPQALSLARRKNAILVGGICVYLHDERLVLTISSRCAMPDALCGLMRRSSLKVPQISVHTNVFLNRLGNDSLFKVWRKAQQTSRSSLVLSACRVAELHLKFLCLLTVIDSSGEASVSAGTVVRRTTHRKMK